jgi:CrcB protein
MLGGATGALSRFILSEKITEKFGSHFPFGTLSVNVLGSFVMGLLAVVLVERMELDPVYRLGIFVGFLGAFTTFSTFSMENFNLFEEGMQMRALLNMVISVMFSVLAVWLGVSIGKAIS